MTNQRTVVVGVDTHADTHHAAVLDARTGELLADGQFRADRTGYAALAELVLAQGEPVRFGVEGTNSYGAGLARHLHRNGFEVAEIVRPNRAARRLRGKSDPLDAVAAAREALAHDDLPAPKIDPCPAPGACLGRAGQPVDVAGRCQQNRGRFRYRHADS